MYQELCSLQEAYAVPSFDTPGKKKKSCGPAMPKNASAEPYDPSFPENGRGETAALREGFQGGAIKDAAKTYKGLANDYNYYRKEYGIATPQLESFKGASDPEKCSSAPQRYEIPLTPEDKAQYDKAMALAIGQSQTATLHPPVERRVADMSKVQGYVDEDLEAYLQTKDMRAAPFVPPPKPNPQQPPAEPYDPESSPFAQAINMFKGQLTPSAAPAAPASPASQTVHVPVVIKSNVWDIVMFVFAGLLIMFLCDQIFQLAMLIGMKRTIAIIEPYLNPAALKQS